MKNLKMGLQKHGWKCISHVFRFYDEITNATIEDYLHTPMPYRHYAVIIRRDQEWLCLGLSNHLTAMVQVAAPYVICHSYDEQFGGVEGKWFDPDDFLKRIDRVLRPEVQRLVERPIYPTV